MQISKWTFLACSTAAIVVWALYKMYRFYKSGEGREFMQRDAKKPPPSSEHESE